MENVDQIIRARWVLPVNPHDTVLEHHAVALRDGRIVAVVPADRLAGAFRAPLETALDDHLLMPVLEAGADEVNDLDGSFEIVCEPSDLVAVRTALQEAGLDYESADASFVPSVHVEVDADGAAKVIKLIDALEDCDDVQNVFANFDAPDEVMAGL